MSVLAWHSQRLVVMSALPWHSQRCHGAFLVMVNNLAQIQQEKQELEEYEKIMRVKHALEYIVYENDRSKVERKIEENETNIKNESSVVNNLQVEKDEIAKNRTSLELDLKTLNNQIQQNEQ